MNFFVIFWLTGRELFTLFSSLRGAPGPLSPHWNRFPHLLKKFLTDIASECLHVPQKNPQILSPTILYGESLSHPNQEFLIEFSIHL